MPDPKPARSKKPLFIIIGVIILVLAVAVSAVIFFCFFWKKEAPDKTGPQVQITKPTSEEWYSTNKNTVSLEGFAVDKSGVKSLSWETNKDKSGSVSISGDAWKAEGISLSKGDNKITIKAVDKKSNSSQISLNVIYNPDIIFYDMTLSQDYLYKDAAATKITVRAAVEAASGKEVSQVNLYKIAGDKKEKQTELLDNGVVANGDDIPGDTIYSGIKSFSSTSADPIILRVGTTIAGSTETAYSGVLKITVLAKPDESKISKVLSLNKETKERFDELKKSGDPKKAAEKLAKELAEKAEIGVAGVSEDGYGVWWQYKETGILAGLQNNPKGTRGEQERKEQAREAQRQSEAAANEQGEVAGLTQMLSSPIRFGVSKAEAAETPGKLEVQNTKAIYLGPYLHDFGNTDDYHKGWKVIKDSKCPECQTVEQKDAEVTVEDFKNLSNYGLVMIVSHGDTWFNGDFAAFCAAAGNCPQTLLDGGGSVVAWTDQQATVGEIFTKYLADLLMFRLAIDANSNTLAVLPSYITAYNGTFPNSLVYVGTCRSTHNFSMAAAFLAKGAKAYFGFSEYVDSLYAGEVANEMIKSFLSKGRTAGESFADAIAAKGSNDKGNPAAFFDIFGSVNLKMGGKNIQNAGFEEGITGWQASGDARVIAQLASLKPQEGKKMGIISTGLGSIEDSNSALIQKICAQEGTATLSFKYNVVSEEPMEYVGSKYDDNFTMTVDINGTKTIVVQKTINNASWSPIGGINFAGGDETTFMTGWTTVSQSLGEIKKDDVIQIEFRVSDKGDSIYDTATLIDDVVLEVK